MLRAMATRAEGEWPPGSAVDSVTLDFDRRHRRRVRLTTDGGLDLLLDLPRTVVLGSGVALETQQGLIEVRAAEEALLEVSARDSHHLLRLAWHLGNRHVPAQILDDALRIRPDHVLAAMLEGLGGEVAPVEAPFEPESGAYARESAGHGHGHDH